MDTTPEAASQGIALIEAGQNQASLTMRRIHNGTEVQTAKPYVVYFIKAAPSPMTYVGWTCGGALVSPEFIITSAACVEDVQHLYAIAGYKKFVDTDQLDVDICTKSKKKKVIFTCVPKNYELQYHKIEKWARIDIAVVRVESPYDFTDQSYVKDCSYIPAPIEINYEPKYQEPGTDTMVLGWGHKDIWRQQSDLQSYNTGTLNYAPTLILGKEACKLAYSNSKAEETQEMHVIIDKYMICTRDAGNIDESGKLLIKTRPQADGCTTKIQQLMGAKGVLCEHDESGEGIERKGIEIGEDEVEIVRRNNDERNLIRRNGICQNDHGGPLVTWVGASEVLIGVASVFKITSDSKCSGPYLFTSTQCNGMFLDCVLNSSTRRTVNELCDAPPAKRGFDKIERRISWIDHPDGPADNELVRTRPQVPLYEYGNNKN